MKKIYLGILTLLSMMSFSAYDYSHAYDKISVYNLDSKYEKMKVNITNDVLQGIGVFNIDGTALDHKKGILNQKILIPKEVKNHRNRIFHHQDPNFTNTAALDKIPDQGTLERSTEVGFNLDKGMYRNNVPLFTYIYDYETKKIHKLYLEDGSRLVFRQINSENMERITPENLAKDNFEFGNGYIEAKDLYKFQIGEIKAKDTSKDSTPNLDRSRHGVTGETVYNYIKNEKDKANLENPTGSLVTDKQVKEYIEKMLKKLLESKK